MIDGPEEDFVDGPIEGDRYMVGYGRPPLRSRFPRGQSGNPRGRPRGARDQNAIVRDLARRTVTILKDGRKKRVTNLDLIVDAIRFQAASGNDIALSLLSRYAVPEPDDDEPRAKGVMIGCDKMTVEEWTAKYGQLDRAGTDPHRYYE